MIPCFLRNSPGKSLTCVEFPQENRFLNFLKFTNVSLFAVAKMAFVFVSKFLFYECVKDKLSHPVANCR